MILETLEFGHDDHERRGPSLSSGDGLTAIDISLYINKERLRGNVETRSWVIA